MGALAPLTPWIPQDDLLLKNAIEAGASLESLAKGAVQFSRRFTIRELQDRWHSLLYDPIISAEASARMMEFERSASSIPSKSSKADNSKEIRSSQGKRKAESVRTCYYAMRKRICHEPLPGDLGFLVQPGDFIGEDETPGPNCMMGHPMEIGLEDANFDDLHHVFPRDLHRSGPTCTVDEFPVLQQDTLEQNGHMDPSKQLASHAIFEANNDKGKNIMCSGFEGFDTSVADCGTSFHDLQYTSPPPAIPDWKHIDGIPVSEVRDDVAIRGDNVRNGDPFGIRDDGGSGEGTSEYDVIPTETKFDDHMSCDVLKHATGCAEGFFAELSDTLFNFTPSDKDILSIDGEKDIIDKSFYDGLSLLLNSPDNSNTTDAIPNMPEKKEDVAPTDYHEIPSKTVPEEHNSGNTHLGDIDVQCCNSDTEMPASALTVNSQFPELRDGVICCTLNTEDPDIPSNDDIVFPSKPRSTSAHRRSQNEANNSALPSKDITGIQTGDNKVGVSSMKRERLGESHPHPPSQIQGAEVGSNQRTDEFGAKKTTKESLNGSSRVGSCQSSLIVVKEEPSDLHLVRQPGYVIDKNGHVSDLGHVQGGSDGINQECQPPSAAGNPEMYSLVSADHMVMEPGGEPLLSDLEEQFSESDGDIPYFSDIESMILEMDLGPDDQDSFSNRKVAKYQNDDAKRAIIRLEQSAHSYMQRAIASHGAFAILYGRHSKHYIKKSEILLGRATDDVVVDIDLGREGRANKISRRQAVIKMDKDGSFSLKNLGKCPIYVNNKELCPGQCFVLHSNCLIEIRGMPFIFETNEACVKKYLANVARKSEVRARNI